MLKSKPDYIFCPSYLPGTLNHEEWEWSLHETNPLKIEINKNYIFTVTDPDLNKIDFDLYGSDNAFVSQNFLEVCIKMNVKFRAPPLQMALDNGEKNKKKYFVFLPAEHVNLMDIEKSEFTEEIDLESKSVMINKNFPPNPIYRQINRLIPDQKLTPHLFRCIEIMELVCTNDFLEAAQVAELKCLEFIPIDENYKYDPWAGW